MSPLDMRADRALIAERDALRSEVQRLQAEIREAYLYVAERNHMGADDQIRAWLLRNTPASEKSNLLGVEL